MVGERGEILRELERRQAEVVALCQALIRIPSEDPPGDNRPICEYLQTYLRARGLETRVVGPDARRPNLVGRLGFARPGPTVVFNGHMETLPVGDRGRWHYDPFAATLTDGRIYGRGAKCMKGGIAALVSAALGLRAYAEQLPGALTLALASDEVNGGGVGTGYLLEQVPEVRGNVALIGEGGWGINFAHKGVLFLRVQAEGEAGHGACDFAERNALHHLMGFLHELRQLHGRAVTLPPDLARYVEQSRAFTDTHLGAGATDSLPRVSVNVGTIHGGQKANVIAEAGQAEVDLRLPIGMSTAELLGEVQALAARYPRLHVQTAWANDPTVSSPEDRWFQLLAHHARQTLGEPLPFTYSHGFTDARFFRQRQIPAAGVALLGQNTGGPDEYIEVDSLLKRTALFALATYDYLTTPHGA